MFQQPWLPTTRHKNRGAAREADVSQRDGLQTGLRRLQHSGPLCGGLCVRLQQALQGCAPCVHSVGQCEAQVCHQVTGSGVVFTWHANVTFVWRCVLCWMGLQFMFAYWSQLYFEPCSVGRPRWRSAVKIRYFWSWLRGKHIGTHDDQRFSWFLTETAFEKLCRVPKTVLLFFSSKNFYNSKLNLESNISAPQIVVVEWGCFHFNGSKILDNCFNTAWKFWTLPKTSRPE